MNKKELKICKEFKVAIEIYEQTEINKSTITFSDLVEKCKKYDLDKNAVSVSIDKLENSGMIYGKCEKENGKQFYGYYINEDFKGFIRGLYNVTCPSQSPKHIHSNELNL